ncbi:MAG TPA: hypothetical protein VGO09_05450, partial [Flavisolibacter sp.]|nr:hypothetical protein [Flavisolibacter sp.]
IGDDKCKIINVYEKYALSIYPFYKVDGIEINKASITLHYDINSAVIKFNLQENKVESMSVTYEEEGDH